MSWFCNHKWEIIDGIHRKTIFIDSGETKNIHIIINRCVKCGKIKKVVIK